jgi:phosphodiesterase/alkaline phosphatase D-like protein
MRSTTIVAKLDGGGTARLALSPDTSFAHRTYTSSVGVRHGVARFSVRDLMPGRTYHYAIEVNGVLDLRTTGSFRVQDEPSYLFAFGSCARSESNHAIFDTIRTLEPAPAFFVHLGDLHYDDIGAKTPADGDSYLPEYRAAYDVILRSARQGALWRTMPIAYTWDDHDYGPNDSDTLSPGKAAAYRAFREYVPHRPLASPTRQGIYQSFVVGRVRYVLTDCRSKRSPKGNTDNANKVVLGAEQEAWFKAELLAANAAGQAVCWGNSKPWIASTVGANDHWGAYATERARLANFIAQHDLARRTFIVGGDMHAVAYYDATTDTHGDYATGGGANLHVLQAGPLDQVANNKGGPYTHGPLPFVATWPGPWTRQFGLCRVTDTGGPTITVAFSARDSAGVELLVPPKHPNHVFEFTLDVA